MGWFATSKWGDLQQVRPKDWLILCEVEYKTYLLIKEVDAILIIKCSVTF